MPRIKDRVGEHSGDLEVVEFAGKPDGRNICWWVVCRRVVEDEREEGGTRECGERERIRASALGGRVCCRVCNGRALSAKLRGPNRQRRYAWTPLMDAEIRRSYEQRAGKKKDTDVPTYTDLARRWRRPKHTVIKRARELGLAFETHEPDWSADELRIMERYSWQTPGALQRTLRRAGFKRSLTAVAVKRKRLNLVAGRQWLTRNDLMRGLGIDDRRKVERWVRAGHLYGHWREHAPGHPDKTGQWIFHRRGVRRFILMYPLEIDLRKVDQTWFFDIITDGNFGENFRDLEEERFMKRGRRAAFVQRELPEAEDDDFPDDEGDEEGYSAGDIPVVRDWRKANAAF